MLNNLRSFCAHVSYTVFTYCLTLIQVDFTAKPVFWKDLTAPLKDKCGHLLTSLSYNPMTNNLTLGIIEARNLKAMDINGKSGKSPCGLFHAEKLQGNLEIIVVILVVQ